MNQVVPTAVVCRIRAELENLSNVTFSSHTACVFQLLTRLIFSDLVGKHISNNMVDTSVEADDCALTEEENAGRIAIAIAIASDEPWTLLTSGKT